MATPIHQVPNEETPVARPVTKSGFSLERLLAPVAKARFFETYSEQRELVVSRDQAGYFSDLLSLGEIDRVIATLNGATRISR